MIITDHALTNDFLVYATDVSFSNCLKNLKIIYYKNYKLLLIVNECFFQSGGLYYFFIEDWRAVNDYKHIAGIKKIYVEPSGRRLILIDDKSDGYVFNPVTTLS